MPKVDHLIPHGKRWDCTKRCAPYHAEWYASVERARLHEVLNDVAARDRLSSFGIPQHMGAYAILVGDIVSGFEVYGPFADGDSAIEWKQRKGNRELTQGQWYLMPLKGVDKP